MRNMRENDEKNEKEKLENLCHVWNTTTSMMSSIILTHHLVIITVKVLKETFVYKSHRKT
jgi:hypothetical protein